MGAAPRGVVTVTGLNGVIITPGIDILSAVIIDPTPMSPEIINNVVVAGPATVSVTCDPMATCFITYRKGED